MYFHVCKEILMLEFNLSYIFGKHVTAPILIWFLWQLFKEFTKGKYLVATKTQDDCEIRYTIPETTKSWEPIKLMREQVIPIKEEEKENYQLWEETEPYPYKPFKPGEHKLTMDVSTIPISYWVVMDKSYKDHILKKWNILVTDYEDVVFHLDPVMINAESGKTVSQEKMNTEIIITEDDVHHADETLCELYSNLVSYLVCRFPQYFRVVLGPGTTPGALYNTILGEYHPVDPVLYLKLSSDVPSCVNYECFNTHVIPECLTKNLDVLKDEVGYRVLISCDKTRRAHELILAMTRLVEDDLTLLSGNTAGQYNDEVILYSGIFAFGSGFNPRSKFLRPLTQIHGPVPGYKNHLQSPMNRFFARLKPNKLAYRVNYAFQKHGRFYSQSRMTNNPATEKLSGGDAMHYRSERQTLIKLKTTEGRDTLVFGLKTYLLNFREEILRNSFYSQPHIMEELRQAVMGINGTFGKYKGKTQWGAPLMEIIEQHQRTNQVH